MKIVLQNYFKHNDYRIFCTSSLHLTKLGDARVSNGFFFLCEEVGSLAIYNIGKELFLSDSKSIWLLDQSIEMRYKRFFRSESLVVFHNGMKVLQIKIKTKSFFTKLKEDPAFDEIDEISESFLKLIFNRYKNSSSGQV